MTVTGDITTSSAMYITPLLPCSTSIQWRYHGLTNPIKSFCEQGQSSDLPEPNGGVATSTIIETMVRTEQNLSMCTGKLIELQKVPMSVVQILL